jgi:hypothetical protein
VPRQWQQWQQRPPPAGLEPARSTWPPIASGWPTTPATALTSGASGSTWSRSTSKCRPSRRDWLRDERFLDDWDAEQRPLNKGDKANVRDALKKYIRLRSRHGSVLNELRAEMQVSSTDVLRGNKSGAPAIMAFAKMCHPGAITPPAAETVRASTAPRPRPASHRVPRVRVRRGQRVEHVPLLGTPA